MGINVRYQISNRLSNRPTDQYWEFTLRAYRNRPESLPSLSLSLCILLALLLFSSTHVFCLSLPLSVWVSGSLAATLSGSSPPVSPPADLQLADELQWPKLLRQEKRWHDVVSITFLQNVMASCKACCRSLLQGYSLCLLLSHIIIHPVNVSVLPVPSVYAWLRIWLRSVSLLSNTIVTMLL